MGQITNQFRENKEDNIQDNNNSIYFKDSSLTFISKRHLSYNRVTFTKKL